MSNNVYWIFLDRLSLWASRMEFQSSRILLATNTDNTGLFEMIVGVFTTCHTQYTWDSSMQLHRWIKKFSLEERVQPADIYSCKKQVIYLLWWLFIYEFVHSLKALQICSRFFVLYGLNRHIHIWTLEIRMVVKKKSQKIGRNICSTCTQPC
jgi:hypothetical protein